MMASERDLKKAIVLAIKLRACYSPGTIYARWHYTLCDVIVKPLTGTLKIVPSEAGRVLEIFEMKIKNRLLEAYNK